MKIFFLTLVLFLCFVTPVFADCSAAQTFDSTPFVNFKDAMFEKFPFSIVSFAIDILDDLSSISPQNPSNVSLHLIGIDIRPLEWIAGDFEDFIAGSLRILMLATLIFGVAKHVVERIL